MKINHNELLSYPNSYDQILFGNIREAWNSGAIAVGATIYFGSTDSRRQITEIARTFAYAHELGMATILWCYLRNPAFKQESIDYHVAADLTGQANHLGVTLQADIIKQKLPENNGGFTALHFAKSDPRMYSQLTSSHPIDLCRYQVANCYMGRGRPHQFGRRITGSNGFAGSCHNCRCQQKSRRYGTHQRKKSFPERDE